MLSIAVSLEVAFCCCTQITPQKGQTIKTSEYYPNSSSVALKRAEPRLRYKEGAL